MDDPSWDLLNAPHHGTESPGDLQAYLSMLVRMTRLHDLGLAQLCLPDLDLDFDAQMDAASRKLAKVSLS